MLQKLQTYLISLIVFLLSHFSFSQNQDINIFESGNLGNAAIGVTTNYTRTLQNAYSGGSPSNNQLNVTGWNITGTNASNFAVSGITFPITINRAASVTFTVSFTPTTSGNHSAILEIYSNDPNENPYVYNLSGNGDPTLITSLTLLNTYPVTVLEPSGLAFDKANNRLFTVSDNTGQVMILSTTGVVLQTLAYLGSDLEGVSMYKSNRILIGVEGNRQLVDYNYVTNTTLATHVMNYTTTDLSPAGDNSRIEGVSYDATNDVIYFLNEKNPGGLIKADGNFNVIAEYPEPLNHGGDYSGTHYVEETGELWIVSDQTSSAYRCNTNGSVIQSFPLTTSGGASLDKAEGITIDYDNNLLYIIADGGQELYVYKINYYTTCPDPIPAEPTPVNCWDDYQFDTNTCSWVNQGTQPTEPSAVNCWDNYQFDTNTCSWMNQGTQPTEPTTVNCWDNYQFDTNTCSWINQGTQPTEPTSVNCWDNYQFDSNSCSWVNQGTQPTEPTAVNCWDNYQFDTNNCTWVNQGTQPTEPTVVNCWDDYQFDSNSCSWVNQGTQPTEPTVVNCWDNYQFDSNLCSWVNQGTLPTEPTAVNCWDNYQFDSNSCSWVNQGTQPTEPTAVNCWDDYQFDTNTCSWVNQGTQPTEPSTVNCWDNYQFDTNTCSWVNQGTQPTEPSAVNCWDNYQFDSNSCSWVNQGTQPTEPTAVNCWDNYQFDTNTCSWVNQGTQPTEPSAVNCWDNYQFDTNTCSWMNQGTQPTEPNTECWETATFNSSTCSWDITNDGDTIDPVCKTQNITIQLDSFGNASITVNDIDNGSSDNCGINSITLSQYDFDSNNVGDNTVTLTVTDHSGNSSSCDAIVTVEDLSLGGIEDWNIENISIYPNPFNQTVNILVNNRDEFTIQIYDINGRLIYNINNITPINKVIRLDNLKVEQGSYLVKIIDLNNGNSAVKQLIKD